MVRQIAPHHWPTVYDFAIVVLALEPEALANRYGLVFQSLEDDLGEYKRAAIELADGAQCILSRHREVPSPGTNVFVDYAADHARARELVLQALDLPPAAFSWINPHSNDMANPSGE